MTPLPALPDDRIAEIARRANALVAAHDAYNANQGGDVLARLSEAEGDFSDYVTDNFRDVAALCALTHGAHADTARLDWLELMTHEPLDPGTEDGEEGVPTNIWRDPECNNAFALEGLDIPNSRGATLRKAIDNAMQSAATRSTPEGNQV